MSGLSGILKDKPWYNCLIPPSSVLTFLSKKYFLLKFAISGKGGRTSFISGLVKSPMNSGQYLKMTEIMFTMREVKPQLNNKKLFLQGWDGGRQLFFFPFAVLENETLP